MNLALQLLSLLALSAIFKSPNTLTHELKRRLQSAPNPPTTQQNSLMQQTPELGAATKLAHAAMPKTFTSFPGKSADSDGWTLVDSATPSENWPLRTRLQEAAKAYSDVRVKAAGLTIADERRQKAAALLHAQRQAANNPRTHNSQKRGAAPTIQKIAK